MSFSSSLSCIIHANGAVSSGFLPGAVVDASPARVTWPWAPARRRIRSGLDSFQDSMRQTSAADVARAQSTLDSLGIGSPRGRRQTADDTMLQRSGSRSRLGGGPSMRRVRSLVDVQRPALSDSGSGRSRALVKSGMQSSLAEEEPAGKQDWDILQAFSQSFHDARAASSRPLFPQLTVGSEVRHVCGWFPAYSSGDSKSTWYLSEDPWKLL